VTRRAGPNPISFVGAAGLVLVLYSGAHVSCFGLHSGGPIMVLWAFSLKLPSLGPMDPSAKFMCNSYPPNSFYQNFEKREF
jgi:hypothetical protein